MWIHSWQSLTASERASKSSLPVYSRLRLQAQLQTCTHTNVPTHGRTDITLHYINEHVSLCNSLVTTIQKKRLLQKLIRTAYLYNYLSIEYATNKHPFLTHKPQRLCLEQSDSIHLSLLIFMQLAPKATHIHWLNILAQNLIPVRVSSTT